MGIGRTNIGGGQKIKRTVLVSEQFVAVNNAVTSKTFTAAEDGYYEFYLSQHISYAITNNMLLTATYVKTINFTVYPTPSSLKITHSAQRDTASGTTDPTTVLNFIEYLKAGTTVTLSNTSGNNAYADADEERNWFKVTKIEGTDNLLIIS